VVRADSLTMRSERNAPPPSKIENLFFLHDNAPAHRSGLVKDFLAKNNYFILRTVPLCISHHKLFIFSFDMAR